MFDDAFFDAAGLEGLSAEQKQGLREQLTDLIQERLATRLPEVLSEEQAKKFGQLMEDGKEVEAFTYLDEVYPEYGELVAEEVQLAQRELMQDMEQVAVKLANDPDLPVE